MEGIRRGMAKDSDQSASRRNIEDAVVDEVNTSEKEEQRRQQGCHRIWQSKRKIDGRRKRFGEVMGIASVGIKRFQIIAGKGDSVAQQVSLMRFFNDFFFWE